MTRECGDFNSKPFRNEHFLFFTFNMAASSSCPAFVGSRDMPTKKLKRRHFSPIRHHFTACGGHRRSSIDPSTLADNKSMPYECSRITALKTPFSHLSRLFLLSSFLFLCIHRCIGPTLSCDHPPHDSPPLALFPVPLLHYQLGYYSKETDGKSIPYSSSITVGAPHLPSWSISVTTMARSGSREDDHFLFSSFTQSVTPMVPKGMGQFIQNLRRTLALKIIFLGRSGLYPMRLTLSSGFAEFAIACFSSVQL